MTAESEEEDAGVAGLTHSALAVRERIWREKDCQEMKGSQGSRGKDGSRDTGYSRGWINRQEVTRDSHQNIPGGGLFPLEATGKRLDEGEDGQEEDVPNRAEPRHKERRVEDHDLLRL